MQDVALQGEIKGAQIVSIADSTPAWNAKLGLGDVIISANRQPVESVAMLRHIAAKAKGKYLLVNVKRGNSALFVPIKGYVHVAEKKAAK